MDLRSLCVNFSRTSANLQLEPKNAREPLDRVLTVHSGRSRDDPCGSPPAQIRTGAFTHTALTKDE